MGCPNLEACNLLTDGYNQATQVDASLQGELSQWQADQLPPEMNEARLLIQNADSPVALAEKLILAQDPTQLCLSCPVRGLQQVIKRGR